MYSIQGFTDSEYTCVECLKYENLGSDKRLTVHE